MPALMLLAFVAALPACFDEPVKPLKQEDVIDAGWEAPASENAVIDALVWCYSNPDHEEVMPRYESLLHSKFFFQMAPEDVMPGKTGLYSRTGDIANTGKLFDLATTLELIINKSVWFDQPELNGEPCDCCRVMTASYFIFSQFGGDGTVYSTRFESAHVTMIVAPHEEDTGTWVIRAIYDLGLE
jgi:hypothetical protein